KKRGRPAKEAAADEREPPKKQGRPAKEAAADEGEPPKKRGRPAKEAAADESEPPKKRGRPAKEAAADESEPPKKRGRPAKSATTAKSAAPAAPSKKRAAISGKHYWLMKAEQDGHDETLKNGEIFNTKFTIDDLRAKTEPEPWDGVRNPTAAKNLRGMKQGDLAFFYASGGKKPAIVGIMEIVKEHEPDMTAWDENSYGYVEQEKDRQKWCVVYVEFRKKFSKPITRDVLKKHFDEGPLSKMQEFNAARLSVSKVSEDEWNFINGLIE
ncbi:uncharacterized protein MYCFIDRAFT_124617, partial [Pseudocercospora fijiensis CIRAD86]